MLPMLPQTAPPAATAADVAADLPLTLTLPCALPPVGAGLRSAGRAPGGPGRPGRWAAPLRDRAARQRPAPPFCCTPFSCWQAFQQGAESGILLRTRSTARGQARVSARHGWPEGPFPADQSLPGRLLQVWLDNGSEEESVRRFLGRGPQLEGAPSHEICWHLAAPTPLCQFADALSPSPLRHPLKVEAHPRDRSAGILLHRGGAGRKKERRGEERR